MPDSNEYADRLTRLRSILIVTSLKKKPDLRARKVIEEYSESLDWTARADFMIDEQVWDHVVNELKIDPRLVFCHPQLIQAHPFAALYYRGITGLSQKEAQHRVGSIGSVEAGNPRAHLSPEKALRMARTYNTFSCSNIANSIDWTLDNGYRTIVATLSIGIDGSWRNRIGDIAEDQLRALIVEWLLENALILEPRVLRENLAADLPNRYQLKGGVAMVFSSEPDISFERNAELLSIVEIKGGVDPAGALERYGAATKSFSEAKSRNPRCKNFYVGAVFTDELNRRLKSDALVEKSFDLVQVLNDPAYRQEFLQEIFRYTLRLL